MADKSFLGAGMKFPPQVNPATGRFMVSTDRISVKESVYLILMTQKTERWVRPDFGSRLMSYTFMDTSATMLNIVAREITEDILSKEPRVADVMVDIDPNVKNGCLIVNIDYRIIADNTRDNLVFPFYLNVTMEEEQDETYR
ncbi:MAG: GPW/gp25 family protein [Lachnospiraceae bacterium]|nr:GPW/gp25 family protein [Lachnospiraceae bacterium]